MNSTTNLLLCKSGSAVDFCNCTQAFAGADRRAAVHLFNRIDRDAVSAARFAVLSSLSDCLSCTRLDCRSACAGLRETAGHLRAGHLADGGFGSACVLLTAERTL